MFHYSADSIVEIEDRTGNRVPIRALLDTGTSATLVLRDFVRKGRAKSYKGHSTNWSTLGGNFKTNRKAPIDFKFPELSTDKTITWICHVDENTKTQQANYNMIIGMDLMTKIGINPNTLSRQIEWEGNSIPMKQCGEIRDRDQLNICLLYTSPSPRDKRQSRMPSSA